MSASTIRARIELYLLYLHIDGMREQSGGTSPPDPPRTGREPLGLSGSQHSAAGRIPIFQ